MNKIIYDFKVSDYSIIATDKLPDKPYRQFKIDGVIYDAITVYDTPGCFGLKTTIPLLGKEIEFL